MPAEPWEWYDWVLVWLALFASFCVGHYFGAHP